MSFVKSGISYILGSHNFDLNILWLRKKRKMVFKESLIVIPNSGHLSTVINRLST